MMRINSNLDDSVALVRDKCSAEDLQWYRREVGKVMGAVCLDIEEKLWVGGTPLSDRSSGPSTVMRCQREVSAARRPQDPTLRAI